MSPGAAPQKLGGRFPALAAIQGPVRAMLDDVLDHMEAVLVADVPFVDEVLLHLKKMRGKLFRPALLALANRIEDDPDRREVALGAVIEMIHLATLVHDDTIDGSALRRGLPTIHSRWGHKVAVITGDYLYSRAMSEITRIGDLELIGLAARVTNDMTIGEMVEIAHHRQLFEDPATYFFLIEKKTASLVATACEMGAAIGAVAHRKTLRTYGHHLGMAFQLIDDLMDYSGEQSVMGKPAGSDLREGQVTYPLLSVLPRLSRAERLAVERVFRPDVTPSPESIDRVLELVHRRGGIEATRQAAARAAAGARDVLSELPPTGPRDILETAVDYVLLRDR